MNLRILKVAVISGTVLGGAAIYKIYGNLFSESLPNRNKNFPDVSKLEKISIFSDGKLTSAHLAPLVTYKNIHSKAKIKIDESQIETTLKPFIKDHLKKVFETKGWNFEELSGRIYYLILGSKIEVYIVWKNNKFAKNYTNYDRLSINF